MSEEKKNVRLVTPIFRVSFPNVWKAKAFKDGDPTFNVQMLFPKDGKYKFDVTKIQVTSVEKLRKIVEEVAHNHWGPKLPGTQNNPFKWPLRDGAEKDLEAYKGMLFANAKSKNKPGLIDAAKNEILEQGEFYAGCWARATISVYAFDIKEFKSVGVGFGLDNIQKVRDDDSFSGKRNAQDDFETIEDLGEDFDEENDEDGEQATAMDF